jgi:hypothetical protein
LERRGVPAVLICTDEFFKLADAQRRALGAATLRIVCVPHPIGGLDSEEAEARGRMIVQPVVQALTQE